MDKRTNCLVYAFIQIQSSTEDLQSGLDFDLRKALKPNPKCLLTLSCFKCSIVSVRHKHVWSSQGLPLPPFIRSDQVVGEVRVDGMLGRQHQALVWDEMGRDARCRETETFLSESCCSYLKCVLLLALEAVTQPVPGDPLKGEYEGGCSQSGIEDEPASHKESLSSALQGRPSWSSIHFCLFEGRKQGCCFNWAMMGCGEIGGILGSTWRAAARSCWLGRETHKWGGGGFTMWYHWVWCSVCGTTHWGVWQDGVEKLWRSGWCCMETHKWGEWRNLWWGVLRFPHTHSTSHSKSEKPCLFPVTYLR